MENKCKHPIKDIYEFSESDSCPDGYGGTDYWTDYYLRCTKCKKQVSIYAQYKGSHNGLYSKYYSDLTGRRLDFEEMKKMFKQNNELFHSFCDFNRDLKLMVMKKPKIDREINKLNILIAETSKNLKSLEKQKQDLWDQKRKP